MAAVRAQERNYPAVASVYPRGQRAFALRDLVSFTPVPKVKPGLRIDGDLSDWPGQPAFTLGASRSSTCRRKPAPSRAISTPTMHIAWDRANLYFAVQVRGQDAAQSGGIKLFLTNAEDQRAV